MKTVILILMFKYGNAGGATSAEFADMASCKAAATQITNSYDGILAGVSAWCVEKEISQ